MPIVASDRDWAREICADAATYAAPTDPEAWLAALESLRQRGVRDNSAATDRLVLFDWDIAAARYEAVLFDE
jgi:glycosyltransferase involved in cell wall biosynthesis